jgi:hypothetical protein
MKQPALRLDTSHVAPGPDNRTTLPAYVQYQQHLARLEALPPHQAPQLAPPLPPAVPPRSDVWVNRAPSAQYVHPVPHNNQTIQYRASPYHGTQSHHRHPSVRLHPPAFNPQQDLARDMDRTPYLQPPPPPPPPPKPGSIWSSRTPGVTSSASTAAEKDRQVMAEGMQRIHSLERSLSVMSKELSSCEKRIHSLEQERRKRSIAPGDVASPNRQSRCHVQIPTLSTPCAGSITVPRIERATEVQPTTHHHNQQLQRAQRKDSESRQSPHTNPTLSVSYEDPRNSEARHGPSTSRRDDERVDRQERLEPVAGRYNLRTRARRAKADG